MRERRKDSRRTAARAGGGAGIVASIGSRLWAKATYRPVNSLALFGAVAASLVIVVNAVFLQSGSHPNQFFANPTSPPPQAAERRSNPAGTMTPKPAAAIPSRSTGSRAPQPIAARPNDPIAELIGSSFASSSHVAAVQRVLSEFGYGQMKPSGILDAPTSAAIEKFESEHKLPVTGRLSAHLLSELSAMTGRPIQ